jgi:hypothetical protein
VVENYVKLNFEVFNAFCYLYFSSVS